MLTSLLTISKAMRSAPRYQVFEASKRRNVGQTNRILANSVVGHKVERRSGPQSDPLHGVPLIEPLDGRDPFGCQLALVGASVAERST